MTPELMLLIPLTAGFYEFCLLAGLADTLENRRAYRQARRDLYLNQPAVDGRIVRRVA